MLNLLERAVDAVDRRLVLLAPPNAPANPHFQNLAVDERYHRRLLADVQRLRGRMYVEDGAISASGLTSDGRHQTPEDERSWHLLMVNPRRGVSACAWYMEHEPGRTTLQGLRVRNCPLASSSDSGRHFHKAVETELARARRDRLRYAEVGGWAVSRQSRCTSEGLILALAAYSLGRIAGGALGLTTATVRHQSSTILRRLGGSSLRAHGQTVPSYFDGRYGCDMELLRFDSRRPNARYARLIDVLTAKLAVVPVIAATALQPNVACVGVDTGAEAGQAA
jgi:hypothetical protein